MKFRAALLAVLTIVAVVVAYAIASFQLAYPESGPEGWLLVAAIGIFWVIVCGLLLKVRKEH